MFPLQTLASLLLGFVLWRGLRHRTMVWVWILPSSILFVVLCAIPESHHDPLLYFFGSGCRVQNHCFARVAVVLPVLTSVAYAIGSVLARTIPRTRILADRSTDHALPFS